ncbi:MAG: hypothetical protein AB9866_17270 [Syntrophobacteraceae bacterium]
MKAGDRGKKVLCCTLKSGRLAFSWLCKFIKVKFQKCKLCKAQRNLNERMSRLGTEIYTLFKQEETDLLKSLVVQQQLKIVEAAESQVFAIHDRIEAIEQDYRKKKEDLAQCDAGPEQPE